MSRRMYASAAVALAGISVLTLAAINPISAQAAGQVQVSLSSQTGTPDWDKTEGPGNDTGPTNDVIRTNDQAIYTVQVATTGTAVTDARITLTIPAGQELRDVPAFCKNPDKLTEIATPTPQLKPPAVPLTADSWRELTSQTLVCAVPDTAANQTQSFQFPAFQRSEVPNGTRLAPATVSVSGQGLAAVRATDTKRMVVSARPQWDVSANGVVIQENSDNVPRAISACSFDETQACYLYYYSVLVSGKNDGRGNTPLTSPVKITAMLNPTSFYGNGVVNSAEWKAAGADANDLYAPRIRNWVEANSKFIPGSKIGVARGLTAENSVRDSGTISGIRGTPGEDSTITITNADWSLYTYPTDVVESDAGIPDNRAYAVSYRMTVEIPARAVRDLGTEVGDGDVYLPFTMRYAPLTALGLDGTSQAVTDDPVRNNYRTLVRHLTKPGGMSVSFAGIPAEPDNTPPVVYEPSSGSLYGPPGNTSYRSGQILVGPRQTVIANVLQLGSYIDNPHQGAALVCNVFDNQKLQLRAGDYPGNRTVGRQRLPSEGESVWFSGYGYIDPEPVKYEVQYGHVATPGREATTCQGVMFYDQPSQVPGNDPDLARQGIYSAVNVVRIWTTIPEPASTANQAASVSYSIALSVVPGQKAGDIEPIWAASVQPFTDGFATRDQLLAKYKTPTSTFDPVTYGGLGGDRLIYAPAYTRVTTTVKDATTKLTNATAGDTVTWHVVPKLSSGGASSFVTSQPVTVETCLPAGVTYSKASIAPAIAQLVTATRPQPKNSQLECDAGNTYLRFVFDDRIPNQPIDPIIITTHISKVAAVGTMTTTSQIQTVPADPSTVAVRSSSAQVSIQQIAGIKLDKIALTPQTQPNRVGARNVEQNQWRITMSNIDNSQAVSNPDIIDALPTKQRNLSASETTFTGTMDFVSAQVTQGTGVQILYTSAQTVSTNPRDPSNGTSGIAWCSAPANGRVVIGRGTCPTSPNQVTGLRFQKPGAFTSGQLIEATITMQARGNTADDSYTNTAQAAVDGLTFTVGPATAIERVIGSSLGDRVWLDTNRNGIQDTGELGVGGFRVNLSGTDDLGNTVTATTTTDKTGTYHFTGLREGTYQVTFNKASLTAGGTFTKSAAGTNRTKDSDGDPTTGVTSPIALNANQTRTDIDQGVILAPIDIMWTKTDGTQPVGGSVWKLTGPTGFPPFIITDCTAQTGSSCTGLDKDPAAGMLRVTGIQPGTYTLVEAKAPAGYVLDATPHKFTVSATQKSPMTIGSFANKPLAVDVMWTKTDGSDRLGGSEWTLTGPAGFAPLTITDCVAETGTSCTGSDKDPGVGVFRLTGIHPGDYVLTETTAPIGFVLDPTPHRFTVTVGDQSPVALGSFVNHPQTGPRLPLTGGTGMLGLYLGGGGVFLLAGGVGLTQYLRRRRATR